MVFRGVVYEINICNKKQTNYNFKFSSYEQKRFKPLYKKKAGDLAPMYCILVPDNYLTRGSRRHPSGSDLHVV